LNEFIENIFRLFIRMSKLTHFMWRENIQERTNNINFRWLEEKLQTVKSIKSKKISRLWKKDRQ